MPDRRKNQTEECTYFNLLFIYFITVNEYRFCISVIGYINMQIIGIGYKKIYIGWSLQEALVYSKFITAAAFSKNLRVFQGQKRQSSVSDRCKRSIKLYLLKLKRTSINDCKLLV